MEEKTDFKSFKKLFIWMYTGFPYRKAEQSSIEKIVSSDDLDMLINRGYLAIKGNIYEGKKKWQYSLGPNALNLIVAWKTDRLIREVRDANRRIKATVTVLLLFGLIAVIVGLILVLGMVKLS